MIDIEAIRKRNEAAGIVDINELCDEVERLQDALKYVRRADKTPGYEYGAPLRDGSKPPTGSRWITPAEKAFVTLNLS